jgi:hypothetical protein
VAITVGGITAAAAAVHPIRTVIAILTAQTRAEIADSQPWGARARILWSLPAVSG